MKLYFQGNINKSQFMSVVRLGKVLRLDWCQGLEEEKEGRGQGDMGLGSSVYSVVLFKHP